MSIDPKSFIAAIVASAVLVVCAGCKTTGTERAAKAAESLAALQGDIAKANTGLDAAVASLDDLVKNPKPDLKPQYAAFTKAMDDLEAQIAATKSRSEAMKARGKEYFAAWEETSKGLSSPEMQQYSEERRAKLNESYEKIKAEVDRVSEIGKPLMDSLRDMRKVLALDLTPSGLALAAEPAKKATASAAELDAEIEKLLADLDGVAKLLSPPAEKK